MSIATLKRKTQTKYNNMSVGSTQGFSLNGVFRNQGYVGQTSLSRSLSRTLPQGYGGCCGTYNNVPVVMSSVTSTENPTIIKKSVMSTSGMLRSKYRWALRPQPYATVKPDVNNNTSDQSTYITKKIKKTISEIKKGNNVDDSSCTNVNTNSPSSCVNQKKVCETVRPEEEYLPISSGLYTELLADACQENDVVTERPTCGVPLPGL